MTATAVEIPVRTDPVVTVHLMGVDAEFGYVVKGTTDVDVASFALIQWRLTHPLEEDTEARVYGLTAERMMNDPEWRERCHSIPPVTRVGWFRWNPCSPRSCYEGGGHKGHLDEADGPGRGNWVGVRLNDTGY